MPSGRDAVAHVHPRLEIVAFDEDVIGFVLDHAPFEQVGRADESAEKRLFGNSYTSPVRRSARSCLRSSPRGGWPSSSPLWSCVTITQVTSTFSMMFTSSSWVFWRIFLSSADIGSSSSSSFGRLTSERASATRCCWPPELMRLALRVLAHLHERERVGHALLDLVLRRAFLLQAERDVRFDRHVREQRVRLEHHVHRAAVRRQRREVLAVDEDLAGGGRLEPASMRSVDLPQPSCRAARTARSSRSSGSRCRRRCCRRISSRRFRCARKRRSAEHVRRRAMQRIRCTE